MNMISRKAKLLCLSVCLVVLVHENYRDSALLLSYAGRASKMVDELKANAGRRTVKSDSAAVDLGYPSVGDPSSQKTSPSPRPSPSTPLRRGDAIRTPGARPGGRGDGEPRQSVLLLSSVGRSGSSFLGEVLASQGRNMYFYEPVRRLRPAQRADGALVKAELRRHFGCDIPAARLGWTVRQPGNKAKKRAKVSGDEVRRWCRREPLRIVKTIRTHLEWTQELLDDEKLNLKVIHLVRDPRGSAVSMEETSWKTSVEDICSKVLRDLQLREEMQRKYPDRYFFIKYEEYCLDPYGKTREILRFLRGGGDQGRDQMRDQKGYREGDQAWEKRRYQREDQKRDQEQNQEGDQDRYHFWNQGWDKEGDQEEDQNEDEEGDSRGGQPRDSTKTRAAEPRAPPASEDLPAEVLLYLDSHVHLSKAFRRTPFTTVRDTSAVHQQWRRRITQAKLTKAEDACRDVILHLNYTLFGSVALARNMSLSMFDYS
nr:uncharacterized protein LOC113829444 [Penaeus vannamei]